MQTNKQPQGLSDYAAETIRHKARQLVGTAGFKKHDIKDIEQEMTLDLLSGLPDDLRELAELLKTHTITEAAETLDIPRSTLYGARDRLRRIFENAGLRDYL